MRAVFIGAGDLTCITARQLLKNRHEVVIIEHDKERIAQLSVGLDAGFIHGDGSKTDILRETDPASTDVLFCLCGTDQYNIIASLVGRSLGYPRIVTRIEDPSYEHICIELGLEDIIVPDFTIARYLADMCDGQNPLEFSALIKDDAQVFVFVAGKKDEGPLAELNLPKGSRLLFFYRSDKLLLPDEKTALREDDEVLIIAHGKVLPQLHACWSPVLPGSSVEAEH